MDDRATDNVERDTAGETELLEALKGAIAARVSERLEPKEEAVIVGHEAAARPAVPGLEAPGACGRPGDGLRLLFGIAEPGEQPTGGAMPASRDAAALVSSGIPLLDERLRGGLFPGLWMIQGRPGVGKTAFMEGVAWEAATGGRPVVYFAAKEGVGLVRERFLDVLAGIMSWDAASEPDRLRWRTDLRRHELSRILSRTVLSRVALIGAAEMDSRSVDDYLSDLERRLALVYQTSARGPLVLVDDLGALLATLRVETGGAAVRAVTGIGALLKRWESPGLAAFADPSGLIPNADLAKLGGLNYLGEGRLELTELSGDLVDVVVRENLHSDWRGTLHLVFDSSVRMFTAVA